MNPALQLCSSSSTPSPQDQKHQHRRNVSTDSCDYEKLPLAAFKQHRARKKLVSKVTVTEDARKVLERFLRHLTPEEELLLRNYFADDKQEAAVEHAYASYIGRFDRTIDDDSNDIYQSFRQFREKEPSFHHHYYDIDQPPQTSRGAAESVESETIHDPKPTQTKSHVREEEYISRLCLGHCADVPRGPPIAVMEDNDHVTSSSTEDYEFPDKELLNRKKKSTFRLALERVQQSFKRQLDKTPLSVTTSSESSAGRKKSQVRSIDHRHPAHYRKRQQSKKSTVSDEKVKVNKSFFETIIQQLRRKGLKLGRRNDRENRSRSAESLNTIIRPLKPEEKKLLERFCGAGYESDSNARSRGQTFLPRRPRMPLPPDVFRDLTLPKKLLAGSSEARNNDEVDGADGEGDKKSSSSSIIPFNLKSREERDELFGRIADQLASIADNYKMVALDSTFTDCVGGVTLDKYIPVRNASQSQPNSAALTPGSIAAELVVSPTYSKFEEILSANVGEGETRWRQIAFVFRLTRSAVHLAGMGTSVAGNIKEFALKYFEEKFASWIADRGGWESMVEDAEDNGTELNSELD